MMLLALVTPRACMFRLKVCDGTTLVSLARLLILVLFYQDGRASKAVPVDESATHIERSDAHGSIRSSGCSGIKSR